MILDLEPFIRVGPLRFGMQENEVIDVFGNPLSTSHNRRGEMNYRYSDTSLRFSKESLQLVEVGLHPEASLIVHEINVFEDPDAFSKILQTDPVVLEHLGFVVFFGLGLTLTGFHDSDESQKGATCFARGRWDHLRSSMRPFNFKEFQ